MVMITKNSALISGESFVKSKSLVIMVTSDEVAVHSPDERACVRAGARAPHNAIISEKNCRSG
jgi:hypothetical protein